MVKLSMYQIDWKEDPDMDEVRKLQKKVGGKSLIYQVSQDEVDSKVYLICSKGLSIVQIDEIWEHGDLYTSDRIWRGVSIASIIEQLKDYVSKEAGRF
jgi:hypothetical protein